MVKPRLSLALLIAAATSAQAQVRVASPDGRSRVTVGIPSNRPRLIRPAR